MQQHVAIWVDGKGVAIGSELDRKRADGDVIQLSSICKRYESDIECTTCSLCM